MMEFALVLPVLLTLLYGVLETGRLLFIYASTVTAARQAVRYGSATGPSPNGMPFYNDCAGIEEAAQRVGFINDFEDVNISYDRGLDESGNPRSPINTCGGLAPNNGDRIVVEVTALWEPIVPIVPLDPFTITSQSERTILASISIDVTAVPQNTGLIVLSVDPSSLTYDVAGEGIRFSYIISNSSSATGALSGPFTVQTTINGNTITTTCSGAPSSLAIGASFTCSNEYVYSITQADMDAGMFTSTSTAYGSGAISLAVPNTFTGIRLPNIALFINAQRTGTTIRYTYAITNSGNVTLSSPSVTVLDTAKFPAVNCSGISSLAPGATASCIVTEYAITQQDVTNGSVVNTATATATPPPSGLTSPSVTSSSTTVTSLINLAGAATKPNPLLAGSEITFTYSLTNTTDSELSGVTFNVSGEGTLISNSCGGSFNIAANAVYTCVVKKTISQSELDRPDTPFAANARAYLGALGVSNNLTTYVSFIQYKLLSIIDLTGTLNPVVLPGGGRKIDYVYTLQNMGNVTLQNPTVLDDKATIDCASDILLPAGTTTCSGFHLVDSTDTAIGYVTNTGTARAVYNGVTISSSNTMNKTVALISGPAFRVTLDANPNPITTYGQQLTYTYTISNIGSVNLNGPFAINTSGSGSSAVNCTGAASPLAPMATTTCTSSITVSTSGIYTVTISSATAENGTVNAQTPLPSLSATAALCTISNLTLNVSATDFKGQKNLQEWTITNNVGAPLNITSFSFNWDTLGNRYLTAVRLYQGTTTLMSSAVTDTDGYFSYSAPMTISSGTPTNLRLTFSKEANLVTGLNFVFAESGCHLP